jgi:hypothetical protein
VELAVYVIFVAAYINFSVVCAGVVVVAQNQIKIKIKINNNLSEIKSLNKLYISF